MRRFGMTQSEFEDFKLYLGWHPVIEMLRYQYQDAYADFRYPVNLDDALRWMYQQLIDFDDFIEKFEHYGVATQEKVEDKTL